MNDRDEWELLGGRLEPGESPEEAVRREIHEEAGLLVFPDKLLRAWIFEPVPAANVLILTYGCSLESGLLRGSQEHSHVQFHNQADLNNLALPAGYHQDIDLWLRQRKAS